jgi:hypothetical protein
MILHPSTYSSDFLQVKKKQTRFLMLVFSSMKGKISRREGKKTARFSCNKALPGFLLYIFSSLACLKKSVFSKRDLLRWKVPASLSPFVKSEKIPVLL